MRVTSKFASTAIIVIAMMAVAVSTASAAPGPVEVEHEGGSHCTVGNPCVGHAEGESRLSLFGFVISDCVDEVTAELNEDGTGHIVQATLQDHFGGGDCTRVPCNGVGEASSEVEWDITNTRETATNAGIMDVNFCLDAAGNPNGTGTHCNTPAEWSEEAAVHHFNVTVKIGCAPLVVEVSWEFETRIFEFGHQ